MKFRKTGFNSFRELVENNSRKEKAQIQVTEETSRHVYLGIGSENKLQQKS